MIHKQDKAAIFLSFIFELQECFVTGLNTEFTKYSLGYAFKS